MFRTFSPRSRAAQNSPFGSGTDGVEKSKNRTDASVFDETYDDLMQAAERTKG